MSKKITLPTWAAQHWDPPPGQRTLERWARNGNIMPAPQKVGRAYYVRPYAKYVDSRTAASEQMDSEIKEFLSGETIKHTRKPVGILRMDELRALPEAGFYDIGVYFLWLGDQLQYIGQSQQVQRRVHTHKIAKRIPHDRHTFLSLERGLLSVERAYIDSYRPPFNLPAKRSAS